MVTVTFENFDQIANAVTNFISMTAGGAICYAILIWFGATLGGALGKETAARIIGWIKKKTAKKNETMTPERG